VDFANLINNLGDHIVNGLSKGAIYALVALGYTLVYGVLRLINFAHSEVFMTGTWAVLGVYAALSVSAGSSVPMIALALVLALVGAVLASAAVALAVDRVAYRPLRRKNAPPLIYLITAIGCSLVLMEVFGFVLKVFFGRPFGRALVSMPTLVPSKTVITIGDTQITNIQIVVILGALVMMLALDTFVNKSRLGRGVRAVAQDPDTAALMGVNKDRVIMLVFVLGGAMAGVAAMLYTLRFGITKFDIGFLIGIKAFTAAVLGGIGNLRGALVGGLVLGIVESFSSALFSSNWQDVTAFVVLVVVLMFRPTGLLGESLGKARA
jgi:branched-chain amino acid transport system permease protein